MGKEKGTLNPADVQRRKDKAAFAKKNKEKHEKEKSVRTLLDDVAKVDEEIARVQKASDSMKMDKGKC
jgi:hypothetical protein